MALLLLAVTLVCGGAVAYVSARVVQSIRLERARAAATAMASRLRIDEAATEGFEVTCRFVLRGTAHWDEGWTEVFARSRAADDWRALPSIEVERNGPPGAFRLRAEVGGAPAALEEALERCASIEVLPRGAGAGGRTPLASQPSGDACFDAAFETRIAPGALLRLLLDDEARRALLRLHPVAVRQRDGGLVLEKRGYLRDPAALAGCIELAVALGRRAVEAARRVDEGMSYRGEGRLTGEARRHEITSLLERMAERVRAGDARRP
ncbi:MAG: hypothetical protein WKG00_20630 [Polyangiaceae bacterium]